MVAIKSTFFKIISGELKKALIKERWVFRQAKECNRISAKQLRWWDNCIEHRFDGAWKNVENTAQKKVHYTLRRF
jgi:hypothetical protein